MQMLVNFVIGYLVFMNIIGFGLIVLIKRQSDTSKVENTKLNTNKVNTFIVILTILCGFIGLMVAGEMTGYKEDNIVLKRYVPLIVFLLIALAILVYFLKIGGFSAVNI